MIKNLQKIGGIAALGHTATLVVGIVLSFTLMFPLLNAAPDQAQKFLSDNQALVHLWSWIVDWGLATTLVVMLRRSAAVTAQHDDTFVPLHST